MFYYTMLQIIEFKYSTISAWLIKSVIREDLTQTEFYD